MPVGASEVIVGLVLFLVTAGAAVALVLVLFGKKKK